MRDTEFLPIKDAEARWGREALCTGPFLQWQAITDADGFTWSPVVDDRLAVVGYRRESLRGRMIGTFDVRFEIEPVDVAGCMWIDVHMIGPDEERKWRLSVLHAAALAGAVEAATGRQGGAETTIVSTGTTTMVSRFTGPVSLTFTGCGGVRIYEESAKNASTLVRALRAAVILSEK